MIEELMTMMIHLVLRHPLSIVRKEMTISMRILSLTMTTPVKLMTEEKVTQSKPNTVTATAALAHKLRIKARLSYYTARLNSLMAH